jgi:hypothetical protein
VPSEESSEDDFYISWFLQNSQIHNQVERPTLPVCPPDRINTQVDTLHESWRYRIHQLFVVPFKLKPGKRKWMGDVKVGEAWVNNSPFRSTQFARPLLQR